MPVRHESVMPKIENTSKESDNLQGIHWEVQLVQSYSDSMLFMTFKMRHINDILVTYSSQLTKLSKP